MASIFHPAGTPKLTVIGSAGRPACFCQCSVSRWLFASVTDAPTSYTTVTSVVLENGTRTQPSTTRRPKSVARSNFAPLIETTEAFGGRYIRNHPRYGTYSVNLP